MHNKRKIQRMTIDFVLINMIENIVVKNKKKNVPFIDIYNLLFY